MSRSPRIVAATAVLAVLLAGSPAAAGTTRQLPPARESTCQPAGKHYGARPTKHGSRASIQFIGVAHDGKRKAGAEFSGQDIRELIIAVTWKDLASGQAQRLELFSPEGSLYQVLSTPIEAQPGAKVDRVETRLPVGGTWITQYHLYGPWCVHAYLEGDRQPTAARGLVLNP